MFNTKCNEVIRITMTITICMVAGKVMGFASPVYLALYPTIAMTKCRDYSWSGLVGMFYPVLLAASTALLVCNVFADHPFIIWTISLLFFDFMRRRAVTPQAVGRMLMPTFNWILVVIFSIHTTASMPNRIHEILLSMAITIVVAKLFVAMFPVTSKGEKSPVFKPKEVTYLNRLVSLGLIGGGVAFLMIVDLISATFCLVPVIAAATQFDRQSFIKTVNLRFVTQVGGCAVASVFIALMMGHQSVISFYTLILGSIIFLISKWMCAEKGSNRDVHADALLATMLPIQLYVGNVNLGMNSTFLRAFELACTLAILFFLYHLTNRVTDHE
ncbi:DUF2955 domain-containing protein [Vibrio hippocampi]|uniref:DUF2955 domain-containing protein n=1 Tax=Vibrio hippocampi TaxID=654686 RepID=A0ABM8ZMQ2_9VIBR|nr:DUF2955 domain-containing protein [Vibrio hippocampi]CAH0529802.1 hypothetical protein VHP8226_03558 [Vibrio hippocampi]